MQAAPCYRVIVLVEKKPPIPIDGRYLAQRYIDAISPYPSRVTSRAAFTAAALLSFPNRCYLRCLFLGCTDDTIDRPCTGIMHMRSHPVAGLRVRPDFFGLTPYLIPR